MLNNHTFIICAYKDSPYLEECVLSLINQTERSQIFVATSTPNEHINTICDKYNLPLYINNGKSGIGPDWNFALKQVKTKYATIAHQDDIYFKDYSIKIVSKMNNNPTSILAFCSYSELRNGEIVNSNKLLRIKKLMCFPLKLFQKSIFIRNRVLSLGCPICCPSVTFNMDKCHDFDFDADFKCNLDWDAWSRLARKKGKFIYISDPLMAHRIHIESETTSLLNNGVRFKEDMIIFRRYHPEWICKILCKQYQKSAESNKM